MDRRAILAAAGGAAFLLALVAEFPAAAALRWLAPEGMRASGVTGTLWNGAAVGAEIGPLRLGATEWTLFAPALLAGRASGTLSTHLGDATFSGGVSLGTAGRFGCSGCEYDGSLASLRPLVPALKMLDGRASIRLEALEIRDRWPTRIVGTAKLTGVPLAMRPGQAGTRAPSANFEATVGADPVPEGGLIEAAITDAGGPVEMTARLKMSPPGSYEFAGRAKARAEAPPEIVNALNLLGPKGSDGSTEIAMTGSL